MRYLSTEPVKLPKPMIVEPAGPSPDGKPQPNSSLPAIAKFLLGIYQPSQAFTLGTSQLRSLNKALDALEGEPEDGYYLLDEAEWALIKTVADGMGPHVLLIHARNVPAIIDALDACPSKKPAKAEEPTA